MMQKSFVVVLLAALSCASAFQAPASGVQRRRVSANIFGKNKAAEEAAERARIEAEQEALNAQWAKESQSDFVYMSIFGVGTSLPVIYLLFLAVTSPDTGGAGYQVEQLWQDSKLLEVGGGTLESHHKNMMRDLRDGLPASF
ncbi:hypothetical protein M885DRAFT_578294 [Pelagophyceae sp. CCMP2097]|nr:hypothetical protein M885DRAFT_578294 [Pelagophyceae sp. CCMP2097]